MWRPELAQALLSGSLPPTAGWAPPLAPSFDRQRFGWDPMLGQAVTKLLPLLQVPRSSYLRRGAPTHSLTTSIS